MRLAGTTEDESQTAHRHLQGPTSHRKEGRIWMAHYAFSSSKHYALWEQYGPLQYRPGQRSLHLKRSGHNVMYAFSSFPPLRFMQTIPTNTHSAFRKQYSFSFLEPILITKLQETIPIDIVRGEAFKRTKENQKNIL